MLQEALSEAAKLTAASALTSRSGIRSTNLSWDQKVEEKECVTYHVYFGDGVDACYVDAHSYDDRRT